MGPRLNRILYLICGLTDFAAFVVVFAVSRGLAERHAEPWFLGVNGAGLSFLAGVGSLLGGWLAHRLDARVVFVTGSLLIGVSIVGCGLNHSGDTASVAYYWLLGIGLGLLYPPLIGWLNQETDAAVNHRGVSRTLILFCIAWNVGMMGGQLTAGSLFEWGPRWTYGTAFAVACANFGLALFAASHVRPPVALPLDRPRPAPEMVEQATAFKRLSWIANLGGMFGGSMVIHLLPELAVDIGVNPADHGVLLASWRAVIVVTYLILHFASFWHFRFATSLVSQVLAIVGLVAIAQADSSFTLFVGLALLGQLVGYNYFSGLFYSTAGSTQERRALAAGIHEATLAAGMAIGTIAGGVLGTLVNHRVPYLLAAVVMLVVIVVQSVAWWQWVWPLRRPVATDLPTEVVAQRQ